MPERVGPEPSVYVKLTREQDARNAVLAHEVLTRPLRERTKQLAKDREDYCRKLLEHRLPRRLHWLIDHPRLLKRVLRVVKRWNPTLGIVNLGVQTQHESAQRMAKTWASYEDVTVSGHVFTYIDPSGLPAEVYGPVA